MKIIEYVILSILMILSENLLSQTKGTIIDIKTKNPIPYANIWIESENTGTTSEKDGSFYFKVDLINKNLIISSIGYEKKIFFVDTLSPRIYLTPVIYNISEVVVKPRKEKELVLGKYRKWDVYRYVGGETPRIFARFFPYKEEYENTPYVRKIKIETLSKISAYFNLRIFAVSQNGEPGRDLLPDNLLIDVKTGRKGTIVENLGEKQIKFPDDGLFVAVEVLNLKDNEFIFTTFDKSLNKNIKFSGFMPAFGVIKTGTNQNSWTYREGKWFLDLGKEDDEMNDETKNNFLAVELTLSN